MVSVAAALLRVAARSAATTLLFSTFDLVGTLRREGSMVTVVAANSTKIAYTGRWAEAVEGGGGARLCGWPLSGAAISLRGRPSRRFAVYVDVTPAAAGDVWRVTTTCGDGLGGRFVARRGDSGLLRVAAGAFPKAGRCALELAKVSEDLSFSEGLGGAAAFRGFVVAGARVAEAPEAKARWLEFVGDSDTSGYCAAPPAPRGADEDGVDEDGADAPSRFASPAERRSAFAVGGGARQRHWERSDASLTWAARLAASLGATATILASSGLGQGGKRVIQLRFNLGVLEAIPERKASRL